MSAAEEILDIVDTADRVVGQAPRGEVYARGLRHRVAFILVEDGEGRIFVHRRTAEKLVYPSHYDMFVGGVLGTGEEYAEAALREAEEELGVSGLPQPTPLFRFLYENGDHSWWCGVYQVRCDLPVQPQASEVDWYAFVPVDELDRMLTQGAWAPDGLAAYARLRAAEH
ncbi:NUDIX domain-containing protein [Streptomyces sp. NPDC057638]|uniref:NUDIX domain-containing protein n=1 Tax=Streptomyces sp. NPDC057638 TaxID=3346190 RepID=UPI0036CB9F7E